MPAAPADRGALHAALDPARRAGPADRPAPGRPRGEISLSLYGEVQKEVIEATLADEYGMAVSFRETTTICIERPAGTGAAVELHRRATATRSWPPSGCASSRHRSAAGVAFGLEVELGSMPLAFFTAVEETVRATLRAGPARLAR